MTRAGSQNLCLRLVLRGLALYNDVAPVAGCILRTVEGNNLRPGIHGERDRPFTFIFGRAGMIHHKKRVKLNLIAPYKLDFCWGTCNGHAIVVGVKAANVLAFIDTLARNARGRYLRALGRRNLGREPFKVGSGAVGADLGLDREGRCVEVIFVKRNRIGYTWLPCWQGRKDRPCRSSSARAYR